MYMYTSVFLWGEKSIIKLKIEDLSDFVSLLHWKLHTVSPCVLENADMVGFACNPGGCCSCWAGVGLVSAVGGFILLWIGKLQRNRITVKRLFFSCTSPIWWPNWFECNAMSPDLYSFTETGMWAFFCLLLNIILVCPTSACHEQIFLNLMETRKT